VNTFRIFSRRARSLLNHIIGYHIDNHFSNLFNIFKGMFKSIISYSSSGRKDKSGWINTEEVEETERRKVNVSVFIDRRCKTNRSWSNSGLQETLQYCIWFFFRSK